MKGSNDSPVASRFLFGAVLLFTFSPMLAPAATLEEELSRLYKTYGRDSVARKVAKDAPAASVPPDKKVWEGAYEEEKDEKPNNGFYGFLIRRSYDQVTLTEDPTLDKGVESVRKAEPAMFSYTYDYLAKSTQWSAIGALIRPIKVYHNDGPVASEGLALQDFGLIPSVSITRVTNNKDKTKEVDELFGRVGVYGHWLGILGPLRSLALSGYFTYATNSDNEDGIAAGEVDLEPIFALPGNRTFYRIAGNGSGRKGRAGSLLEFHWRARVHAEYGHYTGDNFPTPEAHRAEDFFRVGPVASLQLDPFFLPRLSASVEYAYLAGLEGEPKDSHHLIASLKLILDRDPETAHWTLNATYEDGKTPLVDEEVRSFMLSLGVKY